MVASVAPAETGLRRVIGTAGRVGQRSVVIIEGVVFLHDDNDVIDLVQIAIRQGQPGRDEGSQREDCAWRSAAWSILLMSWVRYPRWGFPGLPHAGRE